jgi:acetyl esterase
MPSIADLASEINATIDSIQVKPMDVASVRDLAVPSEHGPIPIRVYSSGAGGAQPVTVLIHGGAWIAGSVARHDNMARFLCARSKTVVVSVDYTLAPGAKFPRQIEECETVLAWLRTQGSPVIAVDPTRIALAGDSAGANMVIAMAIRARDSGRPPVQFLALINPVVDLTGSLVEDEETRAFVTLVGPAYIPREADPRSPGLSPLFAGLRSLPTAYFVLGGKDSWRAEQTAFVRKYRDAGNRMGVFTDPEIGHLGPLGAKAAPEAEKSLDAAATAIRTALDAR